MTPRVLVLAKAPVAGRAKTRLGAEVGMVRAADLASAALLDTIRTCTAAVGADRCRLALAGDLADAVDAARLLDSLAGWEVRPQRGFGLAARLAGAHLDLADEHPGPVVQVGMDTPQVTVADLTALGAALDRDDAVLADAEDGGWWALALRDPRGAGVLHGVPMSTPSTGALTRLALEDSGLTVGTSAVRRDVDTAADADAVASACARDSEFARLWAEVRREAS